MRVTTVSNRTRLEPSVLKLRLALTLRAWKPVFALRATDTSRKPLSEQIFAGLETGLSTQNYKHVKKAFAKAYEQSRSTVNAALGGVWHEARTHSAFAVGVFVFIGESLQ
eukprot:5220283-Amphidinium_carterae.1